ncbi:MAG: universal stress protein [Nitrospirota bacterium]
MEIKSILFPTDFSEGSLNAVEYAVDLARRYSAKLYLLHVIHDVVRASGFYMPHMSLDELYKDMEESAKKELERLGIDDLRDLKNVERLVLRGVPYEEIIRFANDSRIDLIVIGTYGRRGLDRVLFGSTATQIVRYAECPVLTVRFLMSSK